MKNHIATGHGFFQRRGIAQIPYGSIRLQPLDVPQIAAGAYQQQSIGAPLCQ
jgi:hypothetical protein